MTAFTGFVTYTDFVAGDDKGDVQAMDLFNGAYGLGQMTKGEGGRVNYTSAHVVETISTNTDGETKIAWVPAQEVLDASTDAVVGYADENGVLWTKAIGEAGNNKVTGITDLKVKYVYDNVVIPQKKLVHLRAVQRAIPLRAKCRRIAITYSQIAQFQAQTDYNMDLNQQLVAQASGELAYKLFVA